VNKFGNLISPDSMEDFKLINLKKDSFKKDSSNPQRDIREKKSN
jgi:hypothetical protein